jgi:ATP-dependent RNA helicase DDX19/DBP5
MKEEKAMKSAILFYSALLSFLHSFFHLLMSDPSPAPVASTLKSPSWADAAEESISDSLSKTALTGDSASAANESKEGEAEEALPINLGLHPNDATAEVTVQGVDLSIYKSASTFEQLGLSNQLLNGVYDMKFTAPSKIQAQALPIILTSPYPNLIGQAHHGSGKTATFSLGVLSRVDPTKQVAQAIVVVPTRELAIQVHSVMERLAKYTEIKLLSAVKAHEKDEKVKGKVSEQVVVGTPGTIMNKIKYREIDSKSIMMMVADEADQMIAQDQLGDQTIRIKRALNPKCQILLFSATFDAQVRQFAKAIASDAIEIAVKTEELSLDSIKQFWMNCANENEKYVTLTNIFGLLEIGQSIIFVHTVATAKELANRMRKDGYTVSLLHGKDMAPQERDKVMEDFRQGKTTVLISTNVLARGIDVLSVTLVVNFDVPLNKFGRPDPETYIHRIGRSGRFGRKGVAINLVYNDKSRRDLETIAKHFGKKIDELPTNDLEKTSEIVQAALK